MRLQEKIDRALREMGRSQQDLAAYLGRHQSRISKWKNGTGEIPPRDLLQISLYLGCSLDYLCDDDLDADPNPRDAAADAGAKAKAPRAAVAPAEAPARPRDDSEAVLLAISRRIGVENVIDHLLGIDGPAKPASAPDPAAAPPVTTAARIAPRGAAVARKPDPGREREREPEPGREKK